MNSLKKKTSPKDISKEQIEDMYFNQNMSQDEIGRHFGFYDRQPIMRLFKKYEINAKSKKETARIIAEKKHKPPTKTELENCLSTMTMAAIGKFHGVDRGTVRVWMDIYGLKSDYFVNSNVKEEINDKKYLNMTPKELAIHFNVEVGVIKQYKKEFTTKEYTVDDIKKKFTEYGYDTDNQGLVKQITYDDPGLYNTIIELTRNHKLYGSKLTEKLYRIFNKYTEDEIDTCKFCKVPLKFYTFALGYGQSDNQICKTCIPNHCGFGVSKVSQELFVEIYKKLPDDKKNICRFHGNGGEFIISIDPTERESLIEYKEHLNKHKYHIDFVCGHKIIEFDGTYWHKDDMKDISKDVFLNYKGYEVFRIPEKDYYKNKDETIQRCLTFLLP